MTFILSSIKILRPLNIFVCVLAVIISANLINGLNSPLLPYTIIVVICFAGATNILNDILDVEVDKINKPNRILPSGKLTIKYAIFIMGALYLTGIIASIGLNPLGRQVALLIAFPLLLLYTSVFKGLPLIGNLIIASVLGLVFLFTEATIDGKLNKLWIPFLLTTLLSAIRELCKDAEDIKGDTLLNFYTFPRIFGLVNTLFVLRVLSIVLCIGGFIIFIYNGLNIVFLLAFIICIQIPLIYVMFVGLNKKSNAYDYSYAAKVLKGVSIAGLVVIFCLAI